MRCKGKETKCGFVFGLRGVVALISTNRTNGWGLCTLDEVQVFVLLTLFWPCSVLLGRSPGRRWLGFWSQTRADGVHLL